MGKYSRLKCRHLSCKTFHSLTYSRLTSGSIGSEEDFNMANGDASSSDSAPSTTNRPALQQFKKQKEQAAIEGN